MKRQILFLFIIISATLAFAGATLEFFRGRSHNDKIILDWKSKDEIALREYVVERKIVNGEFIPIGSVSPKGANSYYNFIDETAFKVNASVYYYRLKIVDLNNSFSYSNEISVFHSVSSVKRTWGSIKAMFR